MSEVDEQEPVVLWICIRPEYRVACIKVECEQMTLAEAERRLAELRADPVRSKFLQGEIY